MFKMIVKNKKMCDHKPLIDYKVINVWEISAKIIKLMVAKISSEKQLKDVKQKKNVCVCVCDTNCCVIDSPTRATSTTSRQSDQCCIFAITILIFVILIVTRKTCTSISSKFKVYFERIKNWKLIEKQNTTFDGSVKISDGHLMMIGDEMRWGRIKEKKKDF